MSESEIAADAGAGAGAGAGVGVGSGAALDAAMTSVLDLAGHPVADPTLRFERARFSFDCGA